MTSSLITSSWQIDIGGFVFLDLASNFKPPQELQDFLDDGDPPIYIGFGSIVVDDPDRFTQMIFKATELASVRALVNKGWGGLGGEGNDVPQHCHMLGNTPHDWLFPRCKAAVHHGKSN
jgi:UDP:flavonoid glycosyltransferase YjiC (YdhE family)